MSIITSAESSLKPLIQSAENEYNPLTMSDEQILEKICSTHVHSSDTEIDVDSLFTLVENTLRRSTHIVDDVVQGSHASLEHIDDKIPQFNSPLCILKQISSEMSCKPPSEEIAHKTTLAILNKLSKYEWDAKAVLTLAAFALEYSEFWLLSQYQSTDPLAKSVAILKRVPLLTKPAAVQKHRQAILEINNLVKATLQVIELLFELEKLTTYNTKDVPALGDAIEQIPVDVYWAIITIAAVVTQIDCLTTESKHKQELSHYGHKIKMIFSTLKNQIDECKKHIEEAEYFRMLWKLLTTPTEIVEVFKFLIFNNDAPQPLYNGATKTLVDISEAIKKKNVYLFISTLDITEEQISVLRPVYDLIKTKDQYQIVWIPIVEVWTKELRDKFDDLKSSMPWYVVQHFGNIAGYKYIKEEWHFRKISVVVLNRYGKVQHTNAFNLIQACGKRAFPFTTLIEKQLNTEITCISSSLGNIFPRINHLIEEQKYIFYYGGNNKKWIKEFTEYATTLANDPFIKGEKIFIELVCVKKEEEIVVERFWNVIESLFVIKIHNKSDTLAQELQKMLSYKNETGWAVLSNGSSVVLSGHETTILKTLAEFDKWKDAVTKKTFDLYIKEYHKKISTDFRRCSCFEIQNVAGKLPETIKCPECSRTMQSSIGYKCCHN